MNFRRIPFSNTQNARDLGGYATQTGVTRWNVFFRSDCPVSFDEKDRQLAKQLNIGAIVDLRGGTNVDDTLCSAELCGVKKYGFAIGDGSVPRLAKDVPQSYMVMLQNTESVKNIFNLFANEQKAVLFHCFAGKDRTGVIAALLLMLAGVADVDVVADYCMSYPYFLPRLRSDFHRTDAEKYVFVPIPEHMEGFLKLFRAKFGSVQEYLSGAGVTRAQQQKIINKFVQAI